MLTSAPAAPQDTPTGRWLQAALLALVLALAAYLRLVNVSANPGWYTDEGTHLDIAQNLLRGRMQYMAVQDSTVLFAKLPVFEGLLAGLLALTQDDITTLRSLTGSLGVITVGLLYAVVRRICGPKSFRLAILAALLLAIYPQAVIYSRLGFSYNLLAPLLLLVCVSLWEYGRSGGRGWLAVASATIGLGALSDLWMFTLAGPLMLIVVCRRWHDIIWSGTLIAIPWSVFILVMVAVAPQAIWFDLRFTLTRLAGLPWTIQIWNLATNYSVLTLGDGWFVVGLVGLFLLQPVSLRWLALLLLLTPILALGRTVALYSLSAYYTIPLLPLVALGVAALILRGAPLTAQTMRCGLTSLQRRWCWARHRPKAYTILRLAASWGVSLMLLAGPLVTSLAVTLQGTRRRLSTAIDPFLIHPTQAREAAAFVNDHVEADDLVIASPAVAWLVDARRADFVMAMAAQGVETPLLPGDLPAERFAYDPSVNAARFVIVDNLWRNWATADIPGIARMLETLTSWPSVLQTDQITVYQNPNRNLQHPKPQP
jgi:hypothetical protein